MPTELSVHAAHQGGMRITATADGHSVVMDYPAGPDRAGLTPLQLLLASLAGCSGNTVAAMLRRAGQAVAGVEVQVRGRRRDEHPTVFSEIAIEFVVRGTGIQPETVARVLETAERDICPVWIMLKAGTPIASSFRIVEE